MDENGGVSPPPSDEVLLELGRLVWAAINLEDVVFAVCRAVNPRGGPYDDTPIGTRIRQARNDLEARPDPGQRAEVDAWLVAAEEALRERNAVVHGTPVTFVALSPTIQPGITGPLLAHYPRDRSRPPVHMNLTVAGLRSVRIRIEKARAGWDTLAVSLHEDGAPEPGV